MNKIRKIFMFIIIIFVVIIIFYQKYNEYFNSKKYDIEKSYKIQITKENTKKIKLTDLILLAIENKVLFDDLALTENFKMKYKKGSDIILGIKNIENLRAGNGLYDGKNVVIIFADRKESIIDIIKKNEPITTEFHFEYKLNDEGLLDDLILVDSYDTYSINGEKIEH